MAGCLLKLFDRSNILLLRVKRSPNRLYKTLLKTGRPTCLLTIQEEPAWLCHSRLGHVNFYSIRRLVKNNMASGVPMITHPNQVCEGRWSRVYMLSGKFEAFDAFKRYKKMIEESSGYKIKTLCPDNGGEFTSKYFASFYEESGIKRHMTAPYSLQQNGVVEWRNRTIMKMAMSLLKGRNIPGEFWGEVVRHAVYLLNRFPSKSLPDITP
ncbi:zinc finger, CCHC-type containing protein [Tanacetum coccineum]